MKLLVFDMGHVFVDFEWESVCLGFCQRAGCDLAALKVMMGEVAKLGYESGHIGTDDFLEEINTRLGTNLNREEFTLIWTTSFRENPDMAQLMQKLKTQLPLYLLSNTNEVHYEWLQHHYDVARHFNELILSYKMRYSKPELQIYHEVLRRSGLPAEECLFIDDLECNIKAASGLGMNTIHFCGVDDLKSKLEQHGLKV